MRARGRPLVMGILNVTPDSFSDGGRHASPGDALAAGIAMADQGADIIDVGGESTRPGADPASASEELERLLPVVGRLAGRIGVPVSVDTRRTAVARACIDAGAAMVNDISAFRDEGMAALVADTGVRAVIAHMHGVPRTFADDILAGDAVAAVRAFLDERAAAAAAAGVRADRLTVDPGIGFGVGPEQSLELILRCREAAGGRPVLIGASRKRFLAHAFPGVDREEASLLAARLAADAGADILRVHDVPGTLGILEEQQPRRYDRRHAGDAGRPE